LDRVPDIKYTKLLDFQLFSESLQNFSSLHNINS